MSPPAADPALIRLRSISLDSCDTGAATDSHDDLTTATALLPSCIRGLSKSRSKRSVGFAEGLATVHELCEYADELQDERKAGVMWQLCALDRQRFRQRIQAAEAVLSSALMSKCDTRRSMAAVTIQKHWRGFSARANISLRYLNRCNSYQDPAPEPIPDSGVSFTEWAQCPQLLIGLTLPPECEAAASAHRHRHERTQDRRTRHRSSQSQSDDTPVTSMLATKHRGKKHRRSRSRDIHDL